jgi:ligand-binding sensor domain-containing protein
MTKTRKAVWLVLAACSLSGFVAAGIIALKLEHVVDVSRSEVRSLNTIQLAIKRYAPEGSFAFDVLSAPAEFKQAELFQGNLYIAGPQGLIEYGPAAKPIRQFAVGQDLPSSALVGLARVVLADSQTDELIVATANKGLLAYDGKSFWQIYPLEKEYRQITCVLGTKRGDLLIGTRQRGVLLFDGRRITALHPTLENIHVTALAGDETDLWVGTIDRGVLHWHGGETETLGEQQGMPDPQVLSIALHGETTYVGTAIGVGVFQKEKFSRVIAANTFATALLATPQTLIIGTEDEGVLTLPLKAASSQIQLPATRHVQTPEVEQLFSAGSDVYALTASALYRMNVQGLDWEQVLQRDPATLTDRDISALAIDASGKLWIGYFNRGLDQMDGPNSPVRHVEDQHVFCVNRILPQPKSGAIDVATANGLVKFGPAGNEEQILTRADGLIADHVTDVAAYGDGLALATPAGLTFLDSGGARSVYAFQGLVNNHVYAMGVSGDQLLAGTLGGISVFDREDVQANYTVANSGLKHNWITAIVSVGNGWMVGTYGAGVLGLNSDGRFYGTGDATGPFDVNFNAMLVTPQHVFVGTLGQGFYVYNRASLHWTQIEEGLPSSNVTAFAANGGYVYVGTDNGLVRIEEQRLP